jgi:hypothetical protein
MSPLLNAILCSAEEIQEKQTSSSLCNDFALYDKVQPSAQKVGLLQILLEKSLFEVFGLQIQNSNPFKFLGGCLKFKLI